jgi:hypothetical protein
MERELALSFFLKKKASSSQVFVNTLLYLAIERDVPAARHRDQVLYVAHTCAAHRVRPGTVSDSRRINVSVLIQNISQAKRKSLQKLFG